MRLFIVAWRESPVTISLTTAGRKIGLETVVATPPEVARRVAHGDVVLSRLDVRPSLDGVEPGVAKLGGCTRGGSPS